MADGRKTIGQRIEDWFKSMSERLGLNWLWTWDRKRREDWEKIDNLSDLLLYAVKNPDVNLGALAQRAAQIGASGKDVKAMVHPELGEMIEDPSSFIGAMLQEAATSPMMSELSEIFGALVFDPYFVELVGGQINPHAPEVEAVRRLLGTGRPYVALGAILSAIGAAASVGTIQGLGDVFLQVGDMLGTPFTAARVIAPIADAVIVDPLQKLANQTFRPADFTRQQWMDLFALGKISPERLGEELARQGYAQDKISWLLDLAKQQPSRSDLVSFWQKDIIGDVEFMTGLRKLGYSEELITKYVRLYKKEETQDNKSTLLGTLRKAYKEHLIGESDFRSGMEKLNYSTEAINLEIAVLQLSWEVEEKTAVKSDIRAAFMSDVIGAPEVEKWLGDAGFGLDVIRLLIATWQKQKAPSYKQLNKSEILAAYGVNVLSRNEAFARLREVGYNEHDATVLIDTYEKKHLATKPPKTYQVKASDIMNAWHAGVIEEKEARARLVEIGMSEDDVQLVFETFKRLHPRVTEKAPRQLQQADILDAYGHGVFTEETAFNRLVALGYSELDAGTLMDNYERRPEARPPEPTISELIGATKRGIIDQAVLSQKLTLLGVRPEDVQFYVAYAVAPLPEKTRSLARGDILNLWKQGRHSRAWALERLLSLNYSPEDAEDILWLAAPDIRDSETYVLWSAGVITDDIAAAMWSGMGFSLDQIGDVLAERGS